MDNPQHYQPLSHALHPPHAQYSSTPTIYDPKSTTTNHHRQEEEEEEEEDDDDEGVVEQQLNQNEPESHASNPASPQSRPGTQQDPQHAGSHESGTKRRPGRPRGSKNRKPRTGTTAVKQQESQFHYQGLQPGAGSTPPQHPDINVHNQQYYEFQWRVLNLCAEFYNAAEELVKGTLPLVIAQSYQMGPSNKVDPLVMLGDAKRICDNLLANPSQLITSPPPPMYTIVPPIYQPVQPQPTATTSTSTSTTSAGSTSKAASSSAAPVISNPQSFVVSLGSAQPSYPQYPVYAPAGQYPTASYYPQYSAYASHGTPYYTSTAQQPATQPTQQQQPTQTPPASTSASVATPAAASAATVTGAPATGAGVNQGAWADEETERLKKLAEESRSVGGSGEIEWDWVVHQWGNGRTRHQILIKATSLGLKESTSRGTKRRRGDDGDGVASPSTPTITASNIVTTTTSASTTSVPPSTSASTSAPAPVPLPTTASPTTSATPGPSPALTHTQRPPPPLKTSSTSSLPWPMPTVAANTPSPIAQVQGSQGEQQRTSYYRPRPSDASTGPVKSIQPGAGTQHQYMYQPNGSVGTSRLGKENGK